jgi:glycosyltransferase involved in cell wall biosynthesis
VSTPVAAAFAPEISIVIPCYNEAEVLPRLLSALDRSVAELLGLGHPTEVLLVDDGSSDGGFAQLREAARTRPWLRALRFRRNFGQTAAMAAGFARARGTCIVALDADMQNDPKDIPLLIDKLHEGYDVVSGWRKDRKDKAITRRLPSRIANWLIGVVGGLPLHDYGCTLKAYRREVLEPVRLYGEMHRFIPIYAKWAGARVTEMVVTHHPRLEGKSKYGLGRTVKVLFDLLTVKFLGDYSTKPLYLFGGAGLTLCLLGMGAVAGVIAEKILSNTWPHKMTLLLLAVMLFIVGIQLIGMGLLAELQVRTYHESQAKPTYLIAEEVNACAESPASSPAAIPPASARSAR